MTSRLVLAAAAALIITAGAARAIEARPQAPAWIAAVVADKGRPAADVERDAERKPAEMLLFAGVKPGMAVVDFLPGGGYFTRMFSKAVGPKGKVYAVYTPPKPSTDPAKPAPTPAAETLAADPAYGNITAVRVSPASLAVPGKADIFWTSQNYHDLHNIPGLDMTAFNKSVFAALKPGGEYIVLDHVGAPGDPEITHTLHRIDPALVRKEVEAAGFTYVAENTTLRNPADDHSLKVFDPAIRGHTDQFIYKFRKPK